MIYPVLLLGLGIQLSPEIIPFHTKEEIIQSTIKESTEYLLDVDSQSNHKYIRYIFQFTETSFWHILDI